MQLPRTFLSLPFHFSNASPPSRSSIPVCLKKESVISLKPGVHCPIYNSPSRLLLDRLYEQDPSCTPCNTGFWRNCIIRFCAPIGFWFFLWEATQQDRAQKNLNDTFDVFHMQPKYQLLSVEQLGGHTSANSKRFDWQEKR